MTAPFEFRAESVRWTEELKLVVRKDGSLGVLPVLVDKRRETRECVPIDAEDRITIAGRKYGRKHWNH